MPVEPWGKPPIPPALKNRGEIVTRFGAFVDSDQTTSRGLYKVVLMVPYTEKYAAMLAVDRHHTMLHFEVFGPGDVEIDEDLRSLLAEG